MHALIPPLSFYLPPQDTMTLLLDHLKRVATKSEVNKMTSANLAVCFGPVLLCPSPQSALGAVEQAMDFKRHIEVLRYLLDIWPQHGGKHSSMLPPLVMGWPGSALAAHISAPGDCKYNARRAILHLWLPWRLPPWIPPLIAFR
jgi:hypothetical protein